MNGSHSAPIAGDKTSLRILLGLAILVLPETANADQLFDRITLITNTADRICNVVSTSGEASSAGVQLEVKGQLSGLVRALADLGFSGSGTITESRYQGVLQKDLADTLKVNATCKLTVFKTLGDKLIAPKTVAARQPPIVVRNDAPSVDGIWKSDNFGDHIGMAIVQTGNRFSATLNTRAGYGHVIQGTWNGPQKRFDISIERTTNINDCKTLMLGHYTPESPDTLIGVILHTDGACDLGVDYSEVRTWSRM
jgi:hypothetical protein